MHFSVHSQRPGWVRLTHHCQVRHGKEGGLFFQVQILDWLYIFLMYQLKPSSLSSFLQSEAQGIHKLWIQNLKQLKGVTHPESRSIYLDTLGDLYHRADALISRHSQQLDPLSSSRLQHIIGRPLEAHISIAKNIGNLIAST